uniref:Uncharacterized protein n=1 Tax=Rhizophora mucronata TaxID=61149 RepID=A0A2P2P1Y9_RHIMU
MSCVCITFAICPSKGSYCILRSYRISVEDKISPQKPYTITLKANSWWAL